MRSARSHAASLARAIYACQDAGALTDTESNSWSSVLFPLEMACGIENVQADPTAAYDNDSWMCGTAWDADERRREAASKYTAGLAIFNFVWAAYEAAIVARCANPGREKIPVLGRTFFKSCPRREAEILGFYSYLELAKTCCRKEPSLWQEIDTSLKRYSLSGAAAAAELARIFRNHVFHGRDNYPWGDGGDHWSYFRFYGVSMLCMALTQMLATDALNGNVQDCNIYNDGEFVTYEPRRLLLRAHLKDAAVDRFSSSAAHQ